MNTVDAPKRHIFTVTELTGAVKDLLEATYPFVWVTGEISNLHYALSGHCYFTLKDRHAQIGAVMFRGQNRALRFALEDGLTVISMGRLNVYEPKGVYQLIVEYIEPAGLGALQLAFQQLKEKLEAEGLFRQENKAPLPVLPTTISIITSPKGAAIRDIFSVIGRRFPNMKLQVVPVAVQGLGAETQIARAISLVNTYGHCDLIILARGGGSLEDLQPFNTEVVARAIAASHIPVVSGVGHETDLTIADLAADLRAPTPSAAAELAVPEKAALKKTIAGHRQTLIKGMLAKIHAFRYSLKVSSARLIRLGHPGKRLADLRLRLDDLTARAHAAASRQFKRQRHRLASAGYRLSRYGLKARIERLKIILNKNHETLWHKMEYLLKDRQNRLGIQVTRLNGLNPLKILERGYSVTRSLPHRTVLTDTRLVEVGNHVLVTLYKGEMTCSVIRKNEYAQTDV